MTSNNKEISFDESIARTIELVDKEIISLLPKGDDRLSYAMRYSVLSPGKRLRPFILLRSSEIWGVNPEYSLRAAAAMEIVHSYSLIHDDLPAMDNDDYRRGLPSCHKKFDEAAAILAGDALLTLAFEILIDKKTHPDSNIRCELVKILASSIGTTGIAGGQMIDLIYEREILADYPQLVHMQYMKTAKLFMACCEMGAVLGNASKNDRHNILEYAKNFGLAFQFIDDLDDISELKTLSNNNVVKLIGSEETLLASKKFIEEACNKIAIFGRKGYLLNDLATKLLDS